MAELITTKKEYLTNIANSIRTKLNINDGLTINDISTKIDSIKSSPDGFEVTFGYVDDQPVDRLETYSITSADLNELGKAAQKMAGKNALMTIADMIYWLNRVVYIPQGYAESTCAVTQNSISSGIVPTVYRGTAISTQSIFNTSNAAGSIVESA